MPFVVKLTSPEGEVFYGSAPDHEGLRYRTRTAEHAEKFGSKSAAEAVFYWFRQVKELGSYTYEAVEI